VFKWSTPALIVWKENRTQHVYSLHNFVDFSLVTLPTPSLLILFPRFTRLQPRHQLCPLHLRALFRTCDFHPFSIPKLPPLLLNCHQPGLEFVSTEDNGKGNFVTLARGELHCNFRFVFGEKVDLKTYKNFIDNVVLFLYTHLDTCFPQFLYESNSFFQ